MQTTAMRVGAIAWMFTGAAHDVLHLVLPRDPVLTAAMRASTLEMGPITLDAELLDQGVSLSMGLAMVAVGLVLLMITNELRSRPDRLRPFGVVALAASVSVLGLSVAFVPGPPVLTFSVATLAFVVALVVRSDPAGERTAAGTPAAP